MKKEYAGLHAALVTPYTETGEVNYRELKKLVRRLIAEGIDGFYVGGSTAETFLLTESERKGILEAVLEENNGEKLRKILMNEGIKNGSLYQNLELNSYFCIRRVL